MDGYLLLYTDWQEQSNSVEPSWMVEWQPHRSCTKSSEEAIINTRHMPWSVRNPAKRIHPDSTWWTWSLGNGKCTMPLARMVHRRYVCMTAYATVGCTLRSKLSLRWWMCSSRMEGEQCMGCLPLHLPLPWQMALARTVILQWGDIYINACLWNQKIRLNFLCICYMPEIPPIVECSQCSNWFYVICVSVPQEALDDSSIDWICQNC